MREKNLIKSREIEMRLSACLQEDGDITMTTELSKMLQNKRSAASRSLPIIFLII